MGIVSDFFGIGLRSFFLVRGCFWNIYFYLGLVDGYVFYRVFWILDFDRSFGFYVYFFTGRVGDIRLVLNFSIFREGFVYKDFGL